MTAPLHPWPTTCEYATCRATATTIVHNWGEHCEVCAEHADLIGDYPADPDDREPCPKCEQQRRTTDAILIDDAGRVTKTFRLRK